MGKDAIQRNQRTVCQRIGERVERSESFRDILSGHLQIALPPGTCQHPPKALLPISDSGTRIEHHTVVELQIIGPDEAGRRSENPDEACLIPKLCDFKFVKLLQPI